MPPSSNLAIICAENIAILSILHNIPVPPSHNTESNTLSFKKNYTLSFNTERKLAGTLAFLAQSKDDVDHIPAICLEENPSSGLLNVLVAVNKTSFADGSGAICRIEDGFKSIFTILAKVPDNVKDEVLTAVVSMCSSRICSRLRLTASRKKRSFKDVLQEAVLAVNKITPQKLEDRSLSAAAKQFTVKVKEVRKLFDLWSRHQVSSKLVRIVEGVNQLQRIERLSSLISMISNQDMSPSGRECLLNIVGKVSRYWEAARFLYRVAKKVPLTRKMRVVPIHLPEDAFDKPLIKEYAPNLESKIAGPTIPRGNQQKLLKEICSGLKLSPQEAVKQFSRQVKKGLTEAKIHAEIQLIAHCEIHRPRLLPRVICSSKDACFLCNLCIQVYQKIWTPRSHGRLYPGWRLPALPELAELQRRLSQALENHFTASCATLLSTRKKTVFPCPNESTLFTLPLSETTIIDPSSSEATSEATIPEKPSEKKHSREAAPTTSSQMSANTGNNPQSTQEVVTEPDNNDNRKNIYNTPQPHENLVDKDKRSEHYILTQGSKESGVLIPGQTSGSYRIGSLQIQIEHAMNACNLEYCLNWLNVDEAAQVRGENSCSFSVVDVERLQGVVTLSKMRTLYLSAKKTMVKVSWIKEDG